MSLGDAKIVGWSGSAGDYYKELLPAISLVDTVVQGKAYRKIIRRLVCLTKNMDLAIAQAKTQGTTLTVPCINADGTAGTITYTGRWWMEAADASGSLLPTRDMSLSMSCNDALVLV